MNSFIKSVLLFTFFLSLLYVGFRYGLREVTQSSSLRQVQLAEPAEWASWKEERFDNLGFSLRHPSEYPTIDGADTTYHGGTYLAVRSAPRFTVVIPKVPFKGTNFLHGFVTVSAELGGGTRTKADSAPCDLLAPEGSDARQLPRREEIGGVTFAVGGVSAAAAGTAAETLVYHALVNGRCIELTANLFSANIRNFDPRKVKQFDRVEAWARLTDIVKTFHTLGKDGR